MMKEACDCSPENCSVNDTSDHVHDDGVCIHPDGNKHDLSASVNMKNKF